MEFLIRKYLDGELSEEEAQEFLEALAHDSELNIEVAALEQVGELAAEQPDVSLSPQFTNRVMNTLSPQSQLAGPVQNQSNWWRRSLPMAASWVLAVGLGYILAVGVPGSNPVLKTSGGGGLQVTTSAAVEQGARPDKVSAQVVRLVYATADSDVSQVAVAGSFNNWNPESTPMHRENGVWVAMLMLPPASYEYMFVENNTTWVTDPLAQSTRDDGFGSRNAILDIGI